MNAQQKQLLSRANEVLWQIGLLMTMAKSTQRDELAFYSVNDFVGLLEKPLDELNACLCNEALDEVL